MKLVKQIPCEVVVLLPAPEDAASMWSMWDNGAEPSVRSESNSCRFEGSERVASMREGDGDDEPRASNAHDEEKEGDAAGKEGRRSRRRSSDSVRARRPSLWEFMQRASGEEAQDVRLRREESAPHTVTPATGRPKVGMGVRQFPPTFEWIQAKKEKVIVQKVACFDERRLVAPEDVLADERTPAGFCLETRMVVNIPNLVRSTALALMPPRSECGTGSWQPLRSVGLRSVVLTLSGGVATPI